jgi:hypothetical protein
LEDGKHSVGEGEVQFEEMNKGRNGLKNEVHPLPFSRKIRPFDGLVRKSKSLCPILKSRRNGSDEIVSMRITSRSQKPVSLRDLHRACIYMMRVSPQSSEV